MTWQKGADAIEDLLGRGHLERVPANTAEAEHLLAKADAHLKTAATLASTDPEIAYDALYAASRKALSALLIQQGLRGGVLIKGLNVCYRHKSAQLLQ